MAQLQSVFILVASVLIQATWGFALNKPDNVGISGGDVVSIEAAPYMAALFLDDHQWCGASIIDERFVLTAAHCLYNIDNGTWRVLVGSDRLNEKGLFMDVEKILCHEKFDMYTAENDICLLKLTEPIPFGCLWTVDKLALPDNHRQIIGGTVANITGWGKTSNDGKISNELRQTSVPVVSNDCCSRVHPNVTKDMICAGSKGHNFCLQDAGGPLTYNGIVIGVASVDATDCELVPGVYTRVSSYLTWIKYTMWGNQFSDLKHRVTSRINDD